MGVQRYLDSLRELHRNVSPSDWLKIGWDFLETMGVGELRGCDLDILPIIERIPPESDFIDVQTFLQHSVVETIFEKLDQGCTTILLDIDKLDGTPSAVLIPRIQEMRVKEIQDVSIPVLGREIVIYDLNMNEIGTEIILEQGESIILCDLWMTAFGYDTLSKLGVGMRCTIKEFDRIEGEFKKAGIKFRLKRVVEELEETPENMSEAMVSYILAEINSFQK